MVCINNERTLNIDCDGQSVKVELLATWSRWNSFKRISVLETVFKHFVYSSLCLSLSYISDTKDRLGSSFTDASLQMKETQKLMTNLQSCVMIPSSPSLSPWPMGLFSLPFFLPSFPPNLVMFLPSKLESSKVLFPIEALSTEASCSDLCTC